MKLAKAFLADQSGATAIEYGLIAGLMCLGIVASMTQVKDGLYGIFNAVRDGLANN
jgi:pilus assembly protein Flp/PilA